MSVVAVTGFPTQFLALRIVRALLERGEDSLRLIVQEKSEEEARAKLAAMRGGERATILVGDSASIDLGLSGAEFVALAAEVEVIHHCAAATYLGVDRVTAERTNIGSAREALELASAAPRLRRLVVWSTALVAGRSRGRVMEDALSEGPFRNVVESTRMRAERMVREAMGALPVTILRPGILVGDSRTGEIDRLDGPYLLVQLMLAAPTDLPIPLPGRGDVMLNVVPVDYVVQAGLSICASAASVGRTFHLVDSAPVTAKRAFELVAEATGRPRPRGSIPSQLPAQFAAALMKTPGLERYANVPRTFLEQLGTDVTFDDRNTRELLAGSGIACPAFEDHVGVMVEHVMARQAERRTRIEVEADDLP